MRNFWTKSLAVTTVTGAMLAGGAGMASAEDGVESRWDETTTNVTGDGIDDAGNIWLGDFLNDLTDIGHVASGNNILSGNDTTVTDNLNGNTADADVNPDVDADVATSTDGTRDGGEGNEGLLGGLF